MGSKVKGSTLMRIEEIFAALLAGEEIVDPCDQGIAAELEGMAAGIEAESFGKLGAVFARGAGELVGASDAVDDVGDFDQQCRWCWCRTDADRGRTGRGDG